MKVNRKPVLMLIVIMVFVAGLLDVKCRGLFFRMLPYAAQTYLASILNHEGYPGSH
ncbi:hypothetical protein [Lentibacillus jeotgali]|uniref:hypothetical protein n=1 Tax=Lentibacillus jeotgali TaxID=558169 RepID=UPI000300E97A|nr:hypothetical protein [Lentibacillus jeotgali]